MFDKFLRILNNIFHPLFNRHCADCKFERLELEERKRDLVIEDYREMLASARLEINRLTTALIELSKPIVEVREEPKQAEQRPLVTGNNRAQFIRKLELEDRQRAAQLRQDKLREHEELRKTDIKEVEKKLGVVEVEEKVVNNG